MQIPNPYLWKNYKLLAIIPAILILVALFFIPRIPEGVDLKGGLLITIQTESPVDAALLKERLLQFSKDVDVRAYSGPAGNGYEIELGSSEELAKAEETLKSMRDNDASLIRAEATASFANTTVEKTTAEERVKQLESTIIQQASTILSSVGSTKTPGADAHQAAELAEQEFSALRSQYTDKIMASIRQVAVVKSSSLKEIGASLSKFFFSKIREILVYSFILGAIVVFLVFRSIVPSFIVIFAAIADVLIALGGMGAFGIPLTLASTAALLMLIGFSLDTDILLTMRVLKRTEGTPQERAFGAMKTGFMMNFAAIAAFGVLALIALWLNVPTYFQIGSVVVMGAAADFATTWCVNAVLVLWDVERKKV